MTIRNDATRTRILIKEKRRPRAIVARQGQVLLDTDLDQQSRHLLERIEIETVDSLGSPGRLLVPAGNTGFKITPDGAAENFNIGAGRGYLGGWLLENTTVCKLPTQPHPRTGDTVTPPSVVALKALVRHIDPVEEPRLADPALGDAQASGRAIVDWQVFPFDITGGGALTCATAPSNPPWQALTAPSSGTLTVLEQAAAPSTDPCSLTPNGGYTRLENLCYRLEVHGGLANTALPAVDGPRFNLNNLKIKFSRRNASVMVRIKKITNTEIEVEPPAFDARNWFAPGQYAEIVSIHDDVDPRAALANERMFRVALADDDRVILEATAAQVSATDATTDGTWFLRLWDAFPGNVGGVATVTATGAASQEIDIGDGLKIKLGAGTFRRGDYWNCTARADGTTDWPKAGAVPEATPPHGPEVRYAPLAAATSSGLEDCRITFSTLSDRELLYRGGDGQMVFAPAGSTMVPLPAKARVALMRGETPVQGATVEWSFVGPAGGKCLIDGAQCSAATGAIPKVTTADGLSEITWSIDASQLFAIHQIRATLGSPSGTGGSPPILFSAAFQTAKQTGYSPGQCKHLAQVDNVQAALDTLCAKIDEEPGIHVLGVFFGKQQKPLQNDAEILTSDLAEGIRVRLDQKIESPLMHPSAFDPMTFVVSVEVPYPVNEADRILWNSGATKNTGLVGFTTVVLRAEPKANENEVQWKLLNESADWVVSRLFQGLSAAGATDTRLLVRLTLLGNFIWGDGERYLDGDTFGTKGSVGVIDLRKLPSGDGRRGGDFRMWFWIKRTFRFVNVTPRPMSPGRSFNVMIQLVDPAPTGGLQLQLAANPSNLVTFSGGGTLVIPAGATQALETGTVTGPQAPRQMTVSSAADSETIDLLS
jgi:hypothetical protein